MILFDLYCDVAFMKYLQFSLMNKSDLLQQNSKLGTFASSVEDFTIFHIEKIIIAQL